MRQVFEAVLIELSKVKAPSMLLADFNYMFNKAINLYINKRYNIYDVNQQTTDDLRVLKSTAILPVRKDTLYKEAFDNNTTVDNFDAQRELGKLFGATYETDLPDDYMHLLNCICIYKVLKPFKCYDANTYVLFSARRLTADIWGQIINDFYNRPLPERPYYYIHNVTTKNDFPTNSNIDTFNGEFSVTGFDAVDGSSGAQNKSNFERTKQGKSLVEKTAENRYGNSSKVRMEIRYGKDDTLFTLEKVFVDYIKAPQYIRLTQELIDLTEDTSLIMEFPDYVCQEIINELVLIVMENTADPRTQTHLQVSLSIAPPPAQALATQS